MPKIKTHKGLAKRFKVTAGGKLKHSRPGRNHLLSGKSSGRKRKLRRPSVVSQKVLSRKIKRMLGES